MSQSFTEAEKKYLITWAIEDHNPPYRGPAKDLQRQHGVHQVVIGHLFAVMALEMEIPQMELVEGPVPEGPVVWPWPTPEAFEVRLKELLSGDDLSYLEELGVLSSQQKPDAETNPE